MRWGRRHLAYRLDYSSFPHRYSPPSPSRRWRYHSVEMAPKRRSARLAKRAATNYEEPPSPLTPLTPVMPASPKASRNPPKHDSQNPASSDETPVASTCNCKGKISQNLTDEETSRQLVGSFGGLKATPGSSTAFSSIPDLGWFTQSSYPATFEIPILEKIISSTPTTCRLGDSVKPPPSSPTTSDKGWLHFSAARDCAPSREKFSTKHALQVERLS
jgi:hypothetical protein